jgi:putative tryptophan/tyrosine transport system substrate-binding protein
MAVERAQVDCIDRSASWAAHPQEPIARPDGGADRGRKTVVATQAREPNSGLIVLNEDFMIAHRLEIISLAAGYRLPAVYPLRFFAELGGLISYGVDLNDNFRRTVAYADRVLRGAKPSELPVQAPVKFELVINLKTAKATSIDIPLQLKQRADEVIE